MAIDPRKSVEKRNAVGSQPSDVLNSNDSTPCSEVEFERDVNIGLTSHLGGSFSRGNVTFYNDQKGYGFIAPDAGGKDVFVHATALERAGMRSLSEGQKVAFSTMKGRSELITESEPATPNSTYKLAVQCMQFDVVREMINSQLARVMELRRNNLIDPEARLNTIATELLDMRRGIWLESDADPQYVTLIAKIRAVEKSIDSFHKRPVD